MTDKLRDTDGDGVVRKGLLSVRTTLNDNGCCVVAAKGELDIATGALLEEELEKAEATSAREIVLDLSELTFMDSTELKLVLTAHSRSREDSDRLSIVRGPRRVQRVFQLTDTDSRPALHRPRRLRRTAVATLDTPPRDGGYWAGDVAGARHRCARDAGARRARPVGGPRCLRSRD